MSLVLVKYFEFYLRLHKQVKSVVLKPATLSMTWWLVSNSIVKIPVTSLSQLSPSVAVHVAVAISAWF